MSPVHIPRGFTQAYIEGEVVEDLPARIRDRPRGLRATATSCSSRAPATPASARSSACRTRPSRRCSGRPRSSCPRAASAGRSTRSCSTPRCSSATACTDRRRDRQQGRPRRQAGPGADARARPRAPRHPAARRPAVPADPVEPDPGDGPRGRPRRDASIPGPDLDQVIGGVAIGAMEPEHMLQRIGPRSLVIVPGDRSDVIGAIVGARASTAPTTASGALGLVLTGGYRPDASVLDAIRARRPVRDARPRGHLPGRLGAPRPAGQDPPGRRRQDRRDQGARCGSTCSSTACSRWPRRRASTDVRDAATRPSRRGGGGHRSGGIRSRSRVAAAPARASPRRSARRPRRPPNSPRIPSAPATAPPPIEPRIVASPALAANRPWAVPPRPAGARAASDRHPADEHAAEARAPRAAR